MNNSFSQNPIDLISDATPLNEVEFSSTQVAVTALADVTRLPLANREKQS